MVPPLLKTSLLLCFCAWLRFNQIVEFWFHFEILWLVVHFIFNQVCFCFVIPLDCHSFLWIHVFGLVSTRCINPVLRFTCYWRFSYYFLEATVLFYLILVTRFASSPVLWFIHCLTTVKPVRVSFMFCICDIVLSSQEAFYLFIIKKKNKVRSFFFLLSLRFV